MATANTLDLFGDGSGVDLITLDGNVDTVNNGSFSVTGDPATFVTGKYGQAYKGTLSTTVKMASPRILPTGKRTDSGSISLWIRQRAVPSGQKILFFYDDNDWGAVGVLFSMILQRGTWLGFLIFRHCTFLLWCTWCYAPYSYRV